MHRKCADRSGPWFRSACAFGAEAVQGLAALAGPENDNAPGPGGYGADQAGIDREAVAADRSILAKPGVRGPA